MTFSIIKKAIEYFCTAAKNVKIAIKESDIAVPTDIQYVVANKYAQLFNADLTKAQSITLDTEGLKTLEIYGRSSVITDYYLDVSNDNTNWISEIYTWSGQTKFRAERWNCFRYVRLRSAAAGTTGDTVDLVLTAKT